jgi:hypothetical protein
MARRSFAETFGHLYEPGSFRDFLDQAYGPNGIMASDLLDPEVRWLVGFLGAEPVGYAKLTPLVGLCTFALGDRIDDDRIWRRHL